MKKNPFQYLGLDPQYLRALPDDLVAQIVKSAFRAFISRYHDDRRGHYGDDPNDRRKKEEFDQRREEVMVAHEILSTPAGRLKAFSEFRGSKNADLKKQIEDLENKVSLVERRHRLHIGQIILDQMGILNADEEQSFYPLNVFRGGRILTTDNQLTSGYEFSIGQDGFLQSLCPCHFVEIPKPFRKEPLWYIEGSQRRPNGKMIPEKPIRVGRKLKAIGTVYANTFEELAKRASGQIEGKATKSKSGLPFLRLHTSEMAPYLHHINVHVMWRDVLVLVDETGVFYFSEYIREMLKSSDLKRFQKKPQGTR